MNKILLLFSFFVISLTSFSQVPQVERDALISFYNSLNGDFWDNNTNWNSTEPVGTWEGITTQNIDGQDHVTSISFFDNSLYGQIPNDILNFLKLTRLSIQYENVTWEIPSNIDVLTELVQLVIHLNQGGVTGVIPESITNCTNLTTLALGNNQLSGPIPDLTSLNLDLFWISGNLFEFGDFENQYTEYQSNIGSFLYIPQRFPSDQYFVLANSESINLAPDISGQMNIYEWYKDDVLIDGLETSSYELNINSPADYGVYKCKVSNSLITDLTIWSDNFHVSDLPSNSLDYNALLTFYNSTDGDNWNNNTNWFDNSKHLNTWHGIKSVNNRVKEIGLVNNNLSGTIPTDIDELTELEVFNIHGNTITGQVPTQIGNLINLTYLDLDFNFLNGNIPDEIGNLSNLEELYLIQCGLSGQIPQSFGNLSNLNILSIFSYINGSSEGGTQNMFYGDFPDLTALPLDQLIIFGNYFHFEDLADEFSFYQANITSFNYSPQYTFDEEEEININVGDDTTMTITDVNPTNRNNNSQTANLYQWYKDNVVISDTNATSYTITNAQESDSGIYHCAIFNTDLPGMRIERLPITVNVSTLSIDDFDFDYITIYPNPVQDYLNINLTKSLQTDMNMYNLHGALIKTFSLNYGLQKIDVTNFSSGIYITEFVTENGNTMVKKLIIQ